MFQQPFLGLYTMWTALLTFRRWSCVPPKNVGDTVYIYMVRRPKSWIIINSNFPNVPKSLIINYHVKSVIYWYNYLIINRSSALLQPVCRCIKIRPKRIKNYNIELTSIFWHSASPLIPLIKHAALTNVGYRKYIYKTLAH